VSLLDITEAAVIQPPKRDTDRKRKINPVEMMNETENLAKEGPRDYNPAFGNRK
tara:strand:+ start:380 stop:541 length:162 start_codon:yes stop_codon:yes gene_type:complete